MVDISINMTNNITANPTSSLNLMGQNFCTPLIGHLLISAKIMFHCK